jgi:hypothetical protein
MQRARRSYRIVSVVLCLALAGLGTLVALTACSNYQEGDRCEILNGNSDCADPLQCTPKAQINTPYNSSDRCCPVDRTTATHPACTVLQSPITGDSAPNDANSGPGADVTVGDAPTDTSTVPDAAPDAADAADAEGG